MYKSLIIELVLKEWYLVWLCFPKKSGGSAFFLMNFVSYCVLILSIHFCNNKMPNPYIESLNRIPNHHCPKAWQIFCNWNVKCFQLIKAIKSFKGSLSSHLILLFLLSTWKHSGEFKFRSHFAITYVAFHCVINICVFQNILSKLYVSCNKIQGKCFNLHKNFSFLDDFLIFSKNAFRLSPILDEGGKRKIVTHNNKYYAMNCAAYFQIATALTVLIQMRL